MLAELQLYSMTGKGEICNGKECGCKWLDEGLRIWHEKSGCGKRVEPSTHKPLNFYEKSMSQNYISFFAKVAFWWNKMLRFTKLYFWAKFWQNFFFICIICFLGEIKQNILQNFLIILIFLLGNIWKNWFRISLPTWLDKFPTFFCLSSGEKEW